MRNVTVIISFSCTPEFAIELKRYSFDHFNNNQSKAIVETLKTAMPKYIREREEFFKKLEILEPTPEQEEQARIEREKQERKSKEEEERRRKSEEYKKSLKIEPKTDPQVERMKSDPNTQLWYKHYREIRTNPNHDPYDCYWCRLYPDLMRIWTERG